VCAQHAARLGVKNRLMPRELAASVLPALRREMIYVQNNFSFFCSYEYHDMSGIIWFRIIAVSAENLA
jgi:hypothetical protein